IVAPNANPLIALQRQLIEDSFARAVDLGTVEEATNCAASDLDAVELQGLGIDRLDHESAAQVGPIALNRVAGQVERDLARTDRQPVARAAETAVERRVLRDRVTALHMRCPGAG